MRWCFIACATSILLMIGNSAVSAKPFALVVPSQVTLHTAFGGHTITDFGYVIATSDTLTLDDFDNGSYSATVSNSIVSDFTAEITPVNVHFRVPLTPGQVGGMQRAEFDPFLLPGETLKAPTGGFFQFSIQFPGGFSGTEQMHVTFSLGQTIAAYTTTLNFVPNAPDAFKIDSAQRVVGIAVPEPTAAAILLMASSGMLVRRRDRSMRALATIS